MTWTAWATNVAGTGDEATGNTVTVKAYAEQGGTLYPITFDNGATTKTIASGAEATCDPIAGLSVTVGGTLYIRTYVTVPSGGRIPGLYAAWTYPDEVNRPGSDLANATGTLEGTGQGFGSGYGPLRVFGDPDSGQPWYAMGVLGDSISAGSTDTFSTEAELGFWQRALWPAGNARPFTILALPSDSAEWYLTMAGKRNEVGNYVDYLVNAYGTNDLGTGVSLSVLQSRMLDMGTYVTKPGMRGLYMSTIPPRTTSTDGWTTVANQTAVSSESVRVAFNDWVRGGMPIVSGAAVAVGTSGALLAGQAGHPYKGFVEVATLAESGVNTGKWKANYTGDGVHPNGTGNAGIASALSLTAFTDLGPYTEGPAPPDPVELRVYHNGIWYTIGTVTT